MRIFRNEEERGGVSGDGNAGILNMHMQLTPLQGKGEFEDSTARLMIACRAGEIFSSERSHRKKFSHHLEFFMRWKTGERNGAKKISPARGHCSFRKLRSPTNGVSD